VSVAGILQFFKMAAVCHLGFVWGIIFDHPRRVLMGLYQSAKFGYDDAVVI